MKTRLILGLCILVLIVVGCAPKVSMKVSDAWYDKNVNQSDCIVENGETLCKITDPCVVVGNGNYSINILECCDCVNGTDGNLSCNCRLSTTEDELIIQ